jgi:hypothetical protein
VGQDILVARATAGGRVLRWRWFGLVTLCGCQGCKSCRPDLPTETEDTAPHDTGETALPSHDTSPEPPCAWPETEPNSIATPNGFAMEEVACGAVQASLDLDAWRFTLDTDSWLMIRIDARSLGSPLDPGLAIAGTDGVSAEVHEYDQGQEDAILVFPALAQDYLVVVTDEVGAGGADSEYELLAGLAKAPVWNNAIEIADNGSRDLAQDLVAGDAVLADIEDASDVDWYAVRVPAGKRTLVLDIDAYTFGSAGNFELSLYDEDAVLIAAAFAGEQGWERDAWLSYTSEGDETVYLNVREEDGRSGRPYWYLLTLTEEILE